ncbi:MAG: hypothetical protein N3C60_02385 [Calditerrivibrio sp.]|nr:hypothetical protein [Calditerrivibrio sp.]
MRTLKELYRASSFLELICRYIEINYGIKITETNSHCLLKILYGIFNRYPDSEEDLDQFVKLNLHECLWNNESYFFRNISQLDFVSKIKYDRELNILSFGCSEGQEPYSLSIVLTEKNIKHKIYGIDVDEIAIRRAQIGIYSALDMRNFDERYTWAFKVQDGMIYINDDLRNNVIFIHNNCMKNRLKDILPCKVDVILCNNVLIYLIDTYVNNIILQFSDVLNENGYILTTHEEEHYFVRFSYFVQIRQNPVVFQKKNIDQIIEKDFRDLYFLEESKFVDSPDEVLHEYEQKLKDNFNTELVRRLVSINIARKRYLEAKKWQYLILLFEGYKEEDMELYMELCYKNEAYEELIDILKKKIDIFKKAEDIQRMMEIARKLGNANLFFDYKSLYDKLYKGKE